MFSSGSPLNPSFWTGDKESKDKDGRSKSKKKTDIDLRRLSVFKTDSVATETSSPNKSSLVRGKSSNSQKENNVPENATNGTILAEQGVIIANLIEEMKKKDEQIAELTEEASTPSIQKRNHRLSQLKTHIIHDNGRLNGLKGVKLARSGSIMTTNVLEAMSDPTKTGVQVIAESLIKVFQKPTDHLRKYSPDTGIFLFCKRTCIS